MPVFCSPAAERVCAKMHSLSDANLAVTVLESFVDVEVCAIEVAGILKEWTNDSLGLFFENGKRSGGGPIEKIVIDAEQRVAIITFESAEGKFVQVSCPPA